MGLTAIIGGTGLDQIDSVVVERRDRVATPFGEPSAALTRGTLAGEPVVFLARHGDDHEIPPHRLNYRANIWALKQAGAERVIAVAAVGGITPDMPPRTIAFPDQVIDYTFGRVQTFFDGPPAPVTHIDFTFPYCDDLRQALVEGARALGLGARESGVYGVMQGPRLETAAEIRRLERDGCDLVGMTAMPEAALARELELCYATVALVVNWAAGKSDGLITAELMQEHLAAGMGNVKRLLAEIVANAWPEHGN